MTDKQKLDQLKKDVPAWRVIGERIPLTKRNGEWVGRCPWHEDKTPSLTVYQKGDAWLWTCFPCSATGNLFQFIERFDGCTFEQAVAKVEKFRVDQTFTPLLKDEQEKVKKTYSLTEFLPAEIAMVESSAAREWLDSRGISWATAGKFHLGFVQKLPAAIQQEHPWQSDGWIIFPTIKNGIITCLKYRSLKGKRTPTGESGIFRAPNMETSLYNLDTINPFEPIHIVEGEPDCLIMEQAGFRCVALPGANYTLSSEERDKLRQAPVRFLAGDSDNPGQQAMLKLWRELGGGTYKISWPTPIKDANEYLLNLPVNAIGTNMGEVEAKLTPFHEKIERLQQAALQTPMPFVYSLTESLQNADVTEPLKDPRRLRFKQWPVIDTWTPLRPGDVMCLFATETGTGKTTFLMNFLLENAMEGKVVVNYSAELTADDYARRVASYLTFKDRQTLTREDFLAAARITQESEARFFIGYQPGAKFDDVLGLLIDAKKHLGGDIFVIDHIHFLIRVRAGDETAALADAMRKLKEFAIEFGVIVIIVGQPRKAQAGVRHRVAVTQDAKGSETFGSDASAVYILHRKRLDQGEDAVGAVFSPKTLVILDKAREGETASTSLWFDGKKCRFTEMSGREEVVNV